ncbi:MAG: PQQ-dependent sugar dehydrogenase, partial [Acidimicrobiales bacterium]
AACGGGGDDDATEQPESTVAAPTTTTTEPDGDTTSTTSPPAVPTTASLETLELALTEVVTADQPVALVVQPSSGRLYVVERTGAVRPIEGGAVGEPLVDISDDTVAEGERGLFGAAFSPDGERLYLSYTNRDGDSRLDEWAVTADGVDDASRRTVLAQAQPFANHNGGHILFGPDGLLWYGLGDGGAAGDPGDRAQDTGTLLGKILRIDPSAQGDDPYGVPGDNPFAGGGGRGEIAVFGARNPWRFSFDPATGALWVADVGQNEIEEVTALPAGQILGANLGWNHLEGSRPFEGEAPPDAIGPTYEYTHAEGTSITGGFVYRGAAIPGLQGAYLFGDLATAQVWALPVDGTEVGERVDLGVGVEQGTLVSFGEDAEGEVYVISIGGSVTRLVAAS